jgi:hypothetical protein
MATTPLFSSYRKGENRVTGSTLAVFERVGLEVLERLLGAAAGGDDLALVKFRNQITDTRSLARVVRTMSGCGRTPGLSPATRSCSQSCTSGPRTGEL